MAEAQFVSLDGTAFHGASSGPNNGMARRSISIFSRRGTDVPSESTPPFIEQEEAIRLPSVPKPKSERQKSWLGRKKGISGCDVNRTKGTVLNAVPRAATIKMTALEEEMATSPNDEILSAVSQKSPSQMAFMNSPTKVSPSQQIRFWSNVQPAPVAQRTESTKRREDHVRIGMWVNGVTHWDENTHVVAEELNIEEETGLTPLRPCVNISILGAPKPNLSVVIPSNQPLVNNMSISRIIQTNVKREMIPVAPAGLVSKFGFISPTITLDEPIDESSLESERAETPAPSPTDGRISIHPEATDSRASGDHAKVVRPSSSSCGSIVEKDDESVHSRLSSATSVEGGQVTKPPARCDPRTVAHDRSAFPSCDPIASDESPKSKTNLDKPLPPIPMSFPVQSAPVPPPSPAMENADSSDELYYTKSTKSAPGRRRADIHQQMLMRPARMRRSVSILDRYDKEFLAAAPHGSDGSSPVTPTLSQAENELHQHLSEVVEHQVTQTEGCGSRQGSVRRGDSVRSIMQPPERAPTVPRRSRKREWRRSPKAAQDIPTRVKSESHFMRPPSSDSSEDGQDKICKAIRKTMSASNLQQEQATIPDLQAPAMLPLPKIVIDDGLIVVSGPEIIVHEVKDAMAQGDTESALTSSVAEDVLLHILKALLSTNDLFNTTQINKGMYRVYKENEMHLIRAVTFNQSPAAWEFREWCPPQSSSATELSQSSLQLEHTPKTYMNCHNGDLRIIEFVKQHILASCQSFVRRETAFALSTPRHPNAQRFTDAFWRIWCFCKIFGCAKNREEDVTGQLDWLKGGLLADNQSCAATVNTNLDFELSSVLLNAPEFFAKGNPGGLNAQQLYDMTEIWTCLSALLSGYNGRVCQAREHGIFDDCDIQPGDFTKEGLILEEWLSHILTLGPDVVAAMVEHANDSSAAGFALAKENGWTKWSGPQYSGSRSNFLKEPVSRLYEERVIAAAARLQNPLEQERRDLSRQRVASLAAEIRLARQASSYKRLPLVDMSSERPMSMASRRSSAGSLRPRHSFDSERSTLVSPMPSPSSSIFVIPRRSSMRSASPRMGQYHQRMHQQKISPIIENRVEGFNRLTLQQYGGGVAEDTSELAVRKIVEMGFSPAEARDALRITDMGDGLRVDRAVDLLIRKM